MGPLKRLRYVFSGVILGYISRFAKGFPYILWCFRYF